MGAYNSMSHVGLEGNHATPEQLKEMSTSWHYAWSWSGPETGECGCSVQPCGLLVPSPSCSESHGKRVGAPRQLHKAAECPA